MVGDWSFWTHQGLFWPNYTSFSVQGLSVKRSNRFKRSNRVKLSYCVKRSNRAKLSNGVKRLDRSLPTCYFLFGGGPSVVSYI